MFFILFFKFRYDYMIKKIITGFYDVGFVREINCIYYFNLFYFLRKYLKF